MTSPEHFPPGISNFYYDQQQPQQQQQQQNNNPVAPNPTTAAPPASGFYSAQNQFNPSETAHDPRFIKLRTNISKLRSEILSKNRRISVFSMVAPLRFTSELQPEHNHHTLF
uniref:BHLH domain-containing protein n=1 Tax=Ascaris lumbricoides TaxID=6252 RepID=A0A0M3ICE1_ASCLU